MQKRFSMIWFIGFLIYMAITTFGVPEVSAAYLPPASNRVDLNLNSDWKFYRADVAGAQDIKFDDADWAAINLPHTWNNMDGQDGGNNYYRGIGWYRKHYIIEGTYSGKSIYLKFEGANSVADVYINGARIGQHKGGYSAFCFDITSQVKIGADNVIAVKVNNAYDADIPPLSADFTFFGGIYRAVHLLVTDKLCVTPLDYASPGIYLKPTKVSAASADLQITAKIKNNYDQSKSVTVKTTIVDAANNVVDTLTTTKLMAAGAGYDFVQNTTISKPHLWNGLSDPYLYRAYVEVQDGGAAVDLVDQPLGIRYFSIDPGKGFILNGKYLDLHGVNRHQDRLNKGWAIGPAEHREDFSLIKEMGCTAIRLAHYQHAEYFYQLCDSGGMVVWAEFPFVNNVTLSDGFYQNAKQQLVELIRQNYNHPAIFFWGLGNEIKSLPSPSTLLQQLNDLAHTEDPTRLTAYAADYATEYAWLTDVNCFNKYDGWYTGTYSQVPAWCDAIHTNHPTSNVGVSEYGAGSGVSIHSATPENQDHSEEYQCLFHEAYWRSFRTRPFIWGKFIWNMFDFAVDYRQEGDTPGRNDKGMVTYDRKIKKDVFFYYQANWSDAPVLYITSRRFTERKTDLTDVKVYSNCDSVELKVNGVSRGTEKGTPDRVFTWTGIKLAIGKNSIEAFGTKNGVQYSDSCSWTVTTKVVPGKIEAENVDDSDGSFRYEPCSEGTMQVDGLTTGDWLEYKVSVNKTATYTVKYRVANANKTSIIKLRLGSKVLATTTVPNTGSGSNWTTVTANVKLNTGPLTLLISVKSDQGFNLDWIEFSETSK
jgi:beta-galactosidase